VRLPGRTLEDAIMGGRFRLLAAVLAALVLCAAAPGAGARPAWCKKDPIVQVDGQTANIVISSHATMDEAATGPVEVVVTAPTGVEAVLRATDDGFGGHGYVVRFAASDALANTAHALQVRVEVYAPAADSSLPVTVEFLPRGAGRLAAGSAAGSANSWVLLVTP